MELMKDLKEIAEAHQLRVEGILTDFERTTNQKLRAKDLEIQELKTRVLEQEKQLKENKKEIKALKAEAAKPRTLQELMKESRKAGTQNVPVGGSPSASLASISHTFIKEKEGPPIRSGERDSSPSPPPKRQTWDGGVVRNVVTPTTLNAPDQPPKTALRTSTISSSSSSSSSSSASSPPSPLPAPRRQLVTKFARKSYPGNHSRKD